MYIPPFVCGILATVLVELFMEYISAERTSDEAT